MKRPSSDCGAGVRGRAGIRSFGRRPAAAPLPTGLSIERATDTVAVPGPGLCTRYRRIATGYPDASPSSGTKGLKASSATRTGSRESVNEMCASGNSPVKLACSSRLNPGALSDPSPDEPAYGGSEPRFEHARDRLRVAALGPDRRQHVLRCAPLVRTVVDLPIAQLAAAAEADAPGADAAEWKRNHRELAAGIRARVPDAFLLRATAARAGGLPVAKAGGGLPAAQGRRRRLP